MKKLILFKNYYINLNFSIILYIENNNYYCYSISSARKFNENKRFTILLNNNELIKNTSIFNLNKNNYLNKYFQYNESILENKKIKYFKEVFYENKGKIKIIGRGWKIIKYSYQLLIKLGYSHLIFINLSPLLQYKLKKKKKKYYLFYGVFYNELNTVLNKIKLMRISNIYTRKGIYYRKIIL